MMQTCVRCIYDERVPRIVFDENGVCNFCKMSDSLREQYKTGTKEGTETFERMVEEIKMAGKGKKYDCVVGVSGGVDSSFMVHYCVQLGLRPLAVHYDNTWNTAIATENIRKVLSKLNIDLYTHIVDNKESDDIFKSFFYSDVPEIDAATDLGFAETHYRAASKYGIKYVLEGHSFLQEGVSPLTTMYFDGMYIKDIHKKFGNIKIKTYPLMDFKSFMKWTVVKKIKKIRPYWYIHYTKAEAIKILEQEYGWQYYGGHHLENRMSAFMHSYYLPTKFKIDQRNNSLSALVRNGFMSREEALRIYAQPPHLETELVEYFKKRLGLSNVEFEKIMNRPGKSFLDYKTYKKRFENMRPIFYMLAKANLVPMSFYLKYCFPLAK
jgi:N-acetyl sugar amidotransferase